MRPAAGGEFLAWNSKGILLIEKVREVWNHTFRQYKIYKEVHTFNGKS